MTKVDLHKELKRVLHKNCIRSSCLTLCGADLQRSPSRGRRLGCLISVERIEFFATFSCWGAPFQALSVLCATPTRAVADR